MIFMKTERITLDTNILIYSIDHDAGHQHTRARTLLDECVDLDCVLTMQALSEFFWVATRKNHMPYEDAAAQIENWQILFPTILPATTTLHRATTAVKRYQFGFWDAMLWAVAKEAGVTKIFTEDFQHARTIESVEFCNPFIA